MPNSELAKEEKIKAWKIIEQYLGNMIKPTNKPDWRISKNKEFSIVIKFSKYDDKSRTFWYGLNPDNLRQWSKYKHSFVVFLIGKHQERLVIPITQLESYIRNANIKPAKGNQIKLHIIFEGGRYLFTEFREFDTSEFYQNDLLETEEASNPFQPALSTSPFVAPRLLEVAIHRNDTIGKVVSEIEEDVEFNPKDIKDARKQIYTSIAIRRGQRKFRITLIEAYEGKCAITGCNVEEALEAAHIIPYKGEHTNKLANGLLLRADIHTLFDLGFIAIDTTTMTVVVAPALAKTEYAKFNNAELNAKPEVLQLIKPALDEHSKISFYHQRTK